MHRGNECEHEKPHVVIIGAGFGGLDAARALKRAPVRVTLVDRENHHTFQPLLYQVATAALSASDIAAPARSILSKQENTSVILAEARDVDFDHHLVILDAGELEYDYLILAVGAETSFFGHDDWSELAPGLKTLDDALEIRRRVLLSFETAEREGDPKRREELLNFCVIGGGPTGVELAGAIAELGQRVLARDFRSIDPRASRVTLVEAGSRLLSTMSEQSSVRGQIQLEELGVRVRLNARVVDIDEHHVELENGEIIICATPIWAAGVRPASLARSIHAEHDRQKRILVERDLSIPRHPEVFAVGDVAALQQDGEWLPGLSPVAKQEGQHAARNIVRTIRGQERLPFRYHDKGVMATIGRSRAVADINSFRLWGFVAWLAWLFVHIFYLIGFRNRVVVIITWAWTYFTYKRGARLIVGLQHPPRPVCPINIDASRPARFENRPHAPH